MARYARQPTPSPSLRGRGGQLANVHPPRTGAARRRGRRRRMAADRFKPLLDREFLQAELHYAFEEYCARANTD